MANGISFRDVIFSAGAWGVTAIVTTDIACHLYCRLSANKPQIHKKSGVRRGYPFIEDLRFCFTAFNEYEQDEPGDTLTHTFTFAWWTYCMTRWVYFFGKVGALWSVSTSPPFSYHNEWTPPPLFRAGDYPFTGTSATQPNQVHININKPATGTGTLTYCSLRVRGRPSDCWFYLAVMQPVGGTSYKVRSVKACWTPGTGVFRYTVSLPCIIGDCLACWGYYGSVQRTVVIGVNKASGYYYSNPLIVGDTINFPGDSYSDPLCIYADNYSSP